MLKNALNFTPLATGSQGGSSCGDGLTSAVNALSRWRNQRDFDVHGLAACKPKRRRKLPPVDFAVQLVRRLINPQLLQFTGQRFVAQSTLLHGFDQGMASSLLPICPHLNLRPKPWRLLDRWEVLDWHLVAYWGGCSPFCQISVVYDRIGKLGRSRYYTSAQATF